MRSTITKISLRDRHGSTFCGGTIIYCDWILTAAHCVENLIPSDFTVYYGITDLAEPDHDIALVKKIMVHEEYSPDDSYANDIALLKLHNILPCNSKSVSPVLLPSKGFEVPINKMEAILIGWGLNQVNNLKF